MRVLWGSSNPAVAGPIRRLEKCGSTKVGNTKLKTSSKVENAKTESKSKVGGKNRNTK